MDDQAIFDHITALDDARQAATIAKAFDQVEAVLGSSLRYVHGSATDEDRSLYLERLRQGFYDYKAMKPIRRDFRRFGDTVLVHGDMQIHVIVDGTEKNFTGRYLQVWAKEGADWKFVAWETTPIPAG
ncbi:MAG: nuclear transport factor 2 family protein [Burkholderiaceae bacterium]